MAASVHQPPLHPGSIVYEPTQTLSKFHRSSAEGRWVIGPYGSGKTHAMIMETLRRCAEQAPDPVDGIRRTRVAIVRNTLQSLKQSVLPDILALLKDLGVHFKVSDSTVQLRFGDMHSDWLLLPLEDPKDQRRLLSLQLTFAWLAEFRELDYDVVSAVTGRVGRYPPQSICPATYAGVYGESNPFSEDSPWYEHLVLNLPQDWEFWRQPSGLAPNAENVQHLMPRYYERMMAGKSEDWIKVHVHGEYGDSVAGQAVFRRSFKRADHVSAAPLQPHPMRPLIIGFDFGRHPAALIGQNTAQGQTLVLAEAHAENMGPIQFARTLLRGLLTSERFVGRRFFVVGDPSGAVRSEVPLASGEIIDMDVFSSLADAGFPAYPALTNDVEPRLRAVEQLFLSNQIVIDGPNCPDLVRALQHDYRFRKKKTDGQLDDKPDKTHPWSDLGDALQYLCLGTSSDYTTWHSHALGAGRESPEAPGALGNAPVHVSAWT